MVESADRDSDLLERFRNGDSDAFTRLYRRHQAAVFRFAVLMTGDQSKATEVTQDVFIWLMHHTERFNPSRGGLSQFLGGVTRKFLKRRRGDELRWVELDESTLRAESGEEMADQDEDAAALRLAILALPEKYREVVVRCDLEEKSYEETAVLLECAVGTVRSRLHRARGLLARKLEKQVGRRSEKCPV